MPAGTAFVDPDDVVRALATPEGRADPYPLYHRLRELAPVHHSKVDGAWYLSSYSGCRQLLFDPRVGYLNIGFDASAESTGVLGEAFVDDAGRERIHRVGRRLFSQERMNVAGEKIRALLAPMLDAIEGDATVDLMEGLVGPLTQATMGELLGIPSEDRGAFRDIMRLTLLAMEPEASAEVRRAAHEGQIVMAAYFRDLIGERRASPNEDLLSGLVEGWDAVGEPSEEWLVNLATTLLMSGLFTESQMIGSSVVALLRHPDEQARVWADAALVDEAVEEALRWDSSAQLMRLCALQDVEWDTHQIDAGAQVVALIGAANRDPARFPDPDEFRVGRPDKSHLSFGGGRLNNCVGAPLARLEAKIVLSSLIERFERVELAEEPLSEGLGSMIRGPAAAPIRVVRR